MKLSRRDFFSIFLLMLALFFIFQFSLIMKDYGNNYDENEYVKDNRTKAADAFVPTQDDECVWIVADPEGGVYDAASQWCTYTKVAVRQFSEIPKPPTTDKVRAIILDPKTVDIKGKTDALYRLAEMGKPMIFANLPDADYVDSDDALKKLLGITELVKNSVHVNGIHMFKGFFLGGETIYKAQSEEEKKYEDIQLDIPWYSAGTGTKTYMVGLMDEGEADIYDFPKLLWRNYHKGTFVYAVNGDYCEGLMGIGFLDSMLYDVSDYYIYPVVNSNNVIMTDFPYLANENTEKLRSIYSRSVGALQRDIIWPGIVSMASKRDFNMTCFCSARYDFMNESESNNDLIFYLQQMKEIGAEAGKSIDFIGNISLAEKIDSDNEYYDSTGSQYKYRCMYTQKWDDSLPALLEEKNPEIRTIVCGDRDNSKALSFCGDNITLMYATNKASDYSFRNALLYKSLQTSLGYSNVLIDMKQVIWPETEEDEWQNCFNNIYSFMTSYWTDDTGFTNTTISQCDDRVRNMLAVKYAAERNEEGLALNIDNVDEAWFILRTHNSEIIGIDHGEFKKLEEDVYLIHAYRGLTRIGLDYSENVYYYDGPFDFGK
ncbi:MAG: DUF2194 domain-containing protein [Lachnospiraceae bacterium]|nr:DUF2194 domain-containing protein [Lachnospiraceae bacterium]